MDTLTPAQVAEYAKKDSRALSQVDLDDLLAELQVRGVESNTLTKQKLSDELEFLSCHIRKRMRENE